MAMGLVTAGAMSGEGGLASGLAFWMGSLVALLVAGLLYDRITSYDLHDQIERGNVAVAIAFVGVLVGFGTFIRLAGEGVRVPERQPDRVRLLHRGRASPPHLARAPSEREAPQDPSWSASRSGIGWTVTHRRVLG